VISREKSVVLSEDFDLKETATDKETLAFWHALPVAARHGGHFISRGLGRHVRRLLPDYELIFVTKGVLEMKAGRSRFAVSAGETLLLRPFEEHWGTKDYGPDLSFFWVHFLLQVPVSAHSPQEECPAPEAQEPPRNAGQMATAIRQHTVVERPDYLAELFRRFLDEQRSGRADALSQNLLVWLMLSEAHPPRLAGPGSGPVVLAALADSYIQLNFHHPLTAARTARHLECNAQYLSRVYRKAYGLTLTEAIHRKRVAHACHLLLESNLRVGEIARSCGMEDVSYFLQLFRRHKGMTATTFRRLHAPAFLACD